MTATAVQVSKTELQQKAPSNYEELLNSRAPFAEKDLTAAGRILKILDAQCEATKLSLTETNRKVKFLTKDPKNSFVFSGMNPVRISYVEEQKAETAILGSLTKLSTELNTAIQKAGNYNPAALNAFLKNWSKERDALYSSQQQLQMHRLVTATEQSKLESVMQFGALFPWENRKVSYAEMACELAVGLTAQRVPIAGLLLPDVCGTLREKNAVVKLAGTTGGSGSPGSSTVGHITTSPASELPPTEVDFRNTVRAPTSLTELLALDRQGVMRPENQQPNPALRSPLVSAPTVAPPVSSPLAPPIVGQPVVAPPNPMIAQPKSSFSAGKAALGGSGFAVLFAGALAFWYNRSKKASVEPALIQVQSQIATFRDLLPETAKVLENEISEIQSQWFPSSSRLKALTAVTNDVRTFLQTFEIAGFSLLDSTLGSRISSIDRRISSSSQRELVAIRSNMSNEDSWAVRTGFEAASIELCQDVNSVVRHRFDLVERRLSGLADRKLLDEELAKQRSYFHPRGTLSMYQNTLDNIAKLNKAIDQSN